MEFLFIGNIMLITTALIMAVIGVLGVAVFNSDRQNATNKAFLLLSFVTICYAIANYWGIAERGDTRPIFTLYALRLTIFFATLHSFLIFHLFYIFPKKDYTIPAWYRLFVIPEVFLVALLTLSPYIFKAIKSFSTTGIAMEIENGLLIPLFGLTVVGLVVASFAVGVWKVRHAQNLERKQLSYLLAGAIITYSLLLILNFVFPALLDNSNFVRHAPLFLTPFIAFTGYAIYKHQLFNIKVLATEAFVLSISIVYFAKLVIAASLTDQFIDGLIFLATVFFGILLVRSVKQEIKAREETRVLAQQLTESNYNLARANEQLKILDQRKSEFVSLVSHQLRTPITVVKGYASMLLEDTYGKLSDTIRAPIEKIFLSSERLVEMVRDFLDLSKIEQGKMSYTFSAVDMKVVLDDLVEEFATSATQKKLKLNFKFSERGSFVVTADEGKMRQVISNLLDNSIKYTPNGSIVVSLEKDHVRDIVSIRVKDTGIGLSPEDRQHVFGKFTRGKEGLKENSGGSGLGLYVAQKMIEAQHGKIWVESEGQGKGSTFVIELPTEKADLGLLRPTLQETT